MHALQRVVELLFVVGCSAEQHFQESVDRGERRAQLMGGVGGEPPHLLLGLTLIAEGNLQPLQHPVEGVGELVDLHLALSLREADIQISGIYALRRFTHIG
ncbi:hypothetical protein D3C73_968640 [compost metagenome]